MSTPACPSSGSFRRGYPERTGFSQTWYPSEKAPGREHLQEETDKSSNSAGHAWTRRGKMPRIYIMEYTVLAGAGNIRLAGHNLLLNYQRVSMSSIDWIVLFGTLLAIVAYGAWKTRGSKTIEGYLKGDNRMKWWMIGISIMATQASAITFLSTPGQAIEDGMRFIQIYFGLPLAMVIL